MNIRGSVMSEVRMYGFHVSRSIARKRAWRGEGDGRSWTIWRSNEVELRAQSCEISSASRSRLA